MRSFWRKKIEIEKDIQELVSLQESAGYKTWMTRYRAMIRLDLRMIFQLDPRNERELLARVQAMKVKYDMLVVVPNEALDLEEELRQVEEDEKREVLQKLDRVNGGVR